MTEQSYDCRAEDHKLLPGDYIIRDCAYFHLVHIAGGRSLGDFPTLRAAEVAIRRHAGTYRRPSVWFLDDDREFILCAFDWEGGGR